MSEKRYEVIESDGTRHEYDDLNQAIHAGGEGATIKDRATGSEYKVRK